eukprot:scaffold1127_cov133-Skeletonema_marinoi.AAC.4
MVMVMVMAVMVMCIRWISCMTRAKYSRLTIEISDEQNSICESSLLVNIAYCILHRHRVQSWRLSL